MSGTLPWFEFNPKAFISDTLRLNTEAKGAYLMLLLDYYESSGSPIPDHDHVLAAITGLPVETWKRHRPVIEPFFTIEGGWKHAYMDTCIEKGRRLHAQATKASAAAAEARTAKAAAKKAKQDPIPTASQATGQETAASSASEMFSGANDAVTTTAMPSTPVFTVNNAEMNQTRHQMVTGLVTSQATHIQEQEHSKKEDSPDGESARASEITTGDHPIPEGFALSAADTIRCMNDGANGEQIAETFDLFRAYHAKAGTLMTDWGAGWWRWWERNKPQPAKPKAKPRVEVSRKIKRAIPVGWKPNASHEAIAIELNLNLDAVEATFRDYCASAGATYVDHDAAFRNFLRNQPKFDRSARRAPPPGNDRSIVSAADRAIRNLEASLDPDHKDDEAPL